jgi:hypothetical protein
MTWYDFHDLQQRNQPHETLMEESETPDKGSYPLLASPQTWSQGQPGLLNPNFEDLSINDHQWPSMTINEHQWPSMTINEHQWPSMTKKMTSMSWSFISFHSLQVLFQAPRVVHTLSRHPVKSWDPTLWVHSSPVRMSHTIRKKTPQRSA